MTPTIQRALVLSVLVVLMAATRINHFAAIPDASWAIFFIGGFYLRSWTRLAFPLLLALAVLIDWVVITDLGIDFWQHYCVSPGYWLLAPAYFAMWGGGMLLARSEQQQDASWRLLPRAAVLLVASVAVCHLFAQGGFYWTSRNVPDPTVAGWLRNYAQWFLPYLGTTALYTGLAALLHVALAQGRRLGGGRHIRH